MPALILDCDGVLADTERDGHLPAFNDAFAEAGLPVHWSDTEYAEKLRIGGGKERIASAFTPELDAAVGIVTEQERADWIKRLHLRKTELFTQRVADGLLPPRSGVHRIIADAVAAGWTVAVASTSAEASVRAVLRRAAGAEAYPRCQVFAGDIVAAKKPAPDIYLKVLDDLGLDPAECVVIEDSGIGLAAATAAGLTTVVTVSSYTEHDDFATAALVLSDLGDPGRPMAVIAAPAGIEPSRLVTLSDLNALITHAQEASP